MFLAPRDAPIPFEEGSFLGQMKDECPQEEILSFYRYINYFENLLRNKINNLAEVANNGELK